MNLKKEYTKFLCNKITVIEEDLTDNEKKLIEESYLMFMEKLEDIKILQDENRRISIELANVKAYNKD